MNKIVLVIIALLGLSVFSCQPKIAEKNILVSRIDTLEYHIYESGEKLLDNRKPKEVSVLYKEYATKYPKDSISVKYLFKAAQVEVGLGENLIAIHTLDTLIIRYPNAEIIPNVLQFKAFIYDDRLDRVNKASETLDIIIKDYPNCDIINNVKAYKATLGKSPEQIILEMEKKNNNKK